MKNLSLAICVTAFMFTISTYAMGAERILTCLYDATSLKNISIKILVDVKKSKVIWNDQNPEGNDDVAQNLTISTIVDEWIYAHNSQNLFVINTNNTRWGMSWVGGGADGVPFGEFVKGTCLES